MITMKNIVNVCLLSIISCSAYGAARLVTSDAMPRVRAIISKLSVSQDVILSTRSAYTGRFGETVGRRILKHVPAGLVTPVSPYTTGFTLGSLFFPMKKTTITLR